MDTKALSHFDRELKRGFEPKMPIELNSKEVELLLLVLAFPNEPMGRYGREIGIEKGSFTYLTDLLNQKELLSVKENPSDSRSKLLGLTAKGHELAGAIRNQIDEHIKSRLSMFSEYEILQLQLMIETAKLFLKRIQEPLRPERTEWN